MNYYEELGITKNATQDEIKQAYRRKAKLIHPDLRGSNEAFIQLNRAYRMLINDTSRKAYDRGDKESVEEFREGLFRRAVGLIHCTLDCLSTDSKLYPAVPVLKLITDVIGEEIAKLKDKRKDLRRDLWSVNMMRKRFYCKRQSNAPILQGIFTDLIKTKKQKKTELTSLIVIHLTALRILKAFDYIAEPKSNMNPNYAAFNAAIQKMAEQNAAQFAQKFSDMQSDIPGEVKL